LASITPGIESNPGNENAGIKTPSPLLTNDWFSIGRVERSSRMRGKFDPEHFGIEHPVVAYTSASALRARRRAGQEITAADIKAALQKQNIAESDIKTGDAIMFHTGWGSLWMKNNDRFNSVEPGIGLDAAKRVIGPSH
jgi:Putative cyclase